MNISPSEVEGKTTEEVLQRLLKYVLKTDEEMEEKKTRSGERTDLNIHLCDNQGFQTGELDEWITTLAESDRITGRASNYVDDHTFSETEVDDHISLVTITTPDKNREDNFLFIADDSYLWTLTTAHSDWRKKTIENLLGYLPCVERLYLSADNLEDLTRGIDDSEISGFTAKYHAPNRQRNATLQFSGAEPGDLETAEEAFDARPTRIEFDQKNSPATAIQGATTNEGRLTMRSVREGSEDKAVDTLMYLTSDYQELDRENFSVDHAPTLHELDSGFSVDGFTSVELTDPDRNDATEEEFRTELKENVLNGNQYRYAIRDGGRKIRVFDTDHGETFDIALEPPDIILYARQTTTAPSLRDFVREVYDDLDSTYSLNKMQNSIARE